MMSSLYKKKAPKISHQDTHVYRNLFRPEIRTLTDDHDMTTISRKICPYASSLNQQAKGTGCFLTHHGRFGGEHAGPGAFDPRRGTPANKSSQVWLSLLTRVEPAARGSNAQARLRRGRQRSTL